MIRIKASLLALGLIGTLPLLGGCGVQSGTTVMTQGGMSDPIMGNAPSGGEYMLFTATGMNPIATVRVGQGDPLGFKRAADGHLVAVAGKQDFDLPGGTAQAYWKRQDE